MSVDGLTMSGAIRKWEQLLEDAKTPDEAEDVASQNGGDFEADGEDFSITDQRTGAKMDFGMKDGRYRVTGDMGEQRLPPLQGDGEQSFGIAFANRYAGRIVHEKTNDTWYVFEGGLWVEDKLQVVALHMQREIIRARTAIPANARGDDRALRGALGKVSFLRASLFAASLQPEISVEIEMFDADPWVLGVPDGYIDLKTGRLHPPDPRKFLTKSTDVMPDEASDPTKWLRFLSEAHKGQPEVIAWLQVFAGLCLTGTMRDEIVVFLHGDGGNGKTVFTYAFGAVLGSYRAVAQESAFTISKQGYRGHAQDIAVLKGARFVVCAEPEEGRMWDMGRVKQWSGNEGKIRANLMRQNGFEFDPQGKLTLVANHRLDIQTVDNAVQRRLRMVPWTNRPAEVDKTLKETLVEEEAGAILAWALEGLRAYLKDGLPACSVIDDATAEYLHEKDVMGRFVADCFEIADGACPIPMTEVGEMFNSWAYANGEDGIKRMIAPKLTAKGVLVKKTNKGQMLRNVVLSAEGCEMMSRALQRRLEAKADNGKLPKMPRPDWWAASHWPFDDGERQQ